ncbi:MAG: FAD-binding oxidoreductase [Alphaproteobacteria bacterium]|nr:FAD-binding oxidoreductase [Alphaproteobacteria bacterium]
MAHKLIQAINTWKNILGVDAVKTDAATLNSFENTTFKTKQRVSAVLYPSSREDVRAILKIANDHLVPLYPISIGKNWGYGSRVPSQDGCAIVCLQALNQIIDYNEGLAYITVEPGVTFQQVKDYLEANKSQLIPPAIGSSPEASLIGNALERGIGKGTYGDRFAHSCAMEIVLADGRIIETGFGAFPNSHAAPIHKWGMGPSLDGLFSQSNFGIVTRMTFWLQPKPQHFQTFLYTIKKPSSLKHVVNALRILRLEGTLTATATISNDYRILSMQQQFPWNEAPQQIPLHKSYIEHKRRHFANAVWVGDDALLCSSPAMGKAAKKRIKQVLGPVVDKLVFIDKTKARWLTKFQKPIEYVTGIKLQQPLMLFKYSLYLGHYMIQQFRMCYWRKQSSIPAEMDLDKDRCGIIWCSPLVPFSGEHVMKALKILKDCYKHYQFEPNIGLNFLSNRSIAFTAAIIFDRDQPIEDEKALACYHAMNDTLEKNGYFAYRSGIQGTTHGHSYSPHYAKVLESLKTTFDPNNIIAPHKYGITAPANEDQTIEWKQSA